MFKQSCMCIVFAMLGTTANAQTPPTTSTTTSANQGSAAATIGQDKRGDVAPTPVQQTRTNSSPGAGSLPMNIKIQGEGIKLPECTSESREGEACKK